MTKGRLMFNGDLIFPKKGAQPPVPEVGYMPDPTDPWVHHRIYKECVYRTFVNIPTPCGCKRYHYTCSLEQMPTTYILCDKCTRAVAGESVQTNETDPTNITIKLDDGSYL
jgi:hypothetical protein